MRAETVTPISMTLQVVQTARMDEFATLANTAVSRELGLHKATRGLFTARRVKAAGRWPLADLASDATARFSFLYVLNGALTLRGEAGPVTLHAHDAVTQLPLTDTTLVDSSEDVEFLEMQCIEGERARRYLPERPTQIVALDSPDAHVVGQGPRSFFDYRELGVAAATGRRLDVQVVRAQKAREGGTGWHSHNMAQLTYGLSGWALLGVEGRAEPVLKERGDALCIPADIAHNAGAFSDDYWALQLQIPADFETTPRKAPEGAL